MGFYTSPTPEDRRFITIDSTGIARLQSPPKRFRREHGWRSWQLMYTTAGQGVGDVDGKEFTAREHTVTFMPADRNYGYQPASDCKLWTYRWIEFSGDLVPAMLQMFGLHNRRQVDNCRDAWPLVEEIATLLETEGNAALHEATALFQQVLTIVERCAGMGRPRTPVVRQIDQAARRFMTDHLQDSFSLEDVARAIHSSPYHLIRVFKRKHGQTPMAYLRHMRAERAKALLLKGGLNISEVGLQVGYPLLQHFSRMFKTEFNCSPRAFLRTQARADQSKTEK
jgi:AraC-like DNA-binding protein